MTDQLKDYEVTQARFIGGQHRAVGDPVKMSVRAAKYYMEPHGAGLTVVAPVVASVDEKSAEKPAAKAKSVTAAKG